MVPPSWPKMIKRLAARRILLLLVNCTKLNKYTVELRGKRSVWLTSQHLSTKNDWHVVTMRHETIVMAAWYWRASKVRSPKWLTRVGKRSQRSSNKRHIQGEMLTEPDPEEWRLLHTLSAARLRKRSNRSEKGISREGKKKPRHTSKL